MDQAEATEVLRARRLEIVDTAKQVRASVGVEADGVRFRMHDREGRVSLVIEVKNDTPSDRALVTFLDDRDRASAAIGYTSFVMVGADDVLSKNRTPMMVFLHGDGHVNWHAPSSIVGSWGDARLVR
jgi:hypothetical protein